ncbi:hypothetical protein lerEdw1_020142 [Lerista edwardsae]|nr:hypothetical protein lerEdw1_020142 [Lerista edwardsae]
MQRLKLPVVDAPVVALGSSSILPVDSEGLPRDSVDRRIEMAVHRAFESAAGALRVSVAGSMFARAVFLWTRDLLTQFDIPDEDFSCDMPIATATVKALQVHLQRNCACNDTRAAGTQPVALLEPWQKAMTGVVRSCIRAAQEAIPDPVVACPCGLLCFLKPGIMEILCNGPGTCVPICISALLLKMLGLKRLTIVYVESLCRVENLSLTGKILYRFSDHFIVQWPALKEKYPKSVYLGRIV